MGISSDGVLYFGFQVGGEDEKPAWLEEFEDFDDFLIAKAGLPESAPYEERSKVIKTCPAEVQLFCSFEYPMYVLGVRGAEHRAYRGDMRTEREHCQGPLVESSSGIASITNPRT